MRDRQDEDHYLLVFDPAHQPVVTDAVAPQPGARAGQGGADAPGVFATGDTAAEKTEDAGLDLPVEPA